MTRPEASSWLGGSVLVWTIFTTTFLWTATMRGFFRADISVWSVLGVQGAGREGTFWLFPALAAFALLAFYLHGHGRVRWLVQTLLLAWHGLLAYIVIAGVLQEGGGYFEGTTWGVRIPLWTLAVPFVGFLALAVLWVVRERREPAPQREVPWRAVGYRSLIGAVVLLPIAAFLFRVGEGFDWTTRLATAVTILQWILLTQALSTPPAAPSACPTPGRRSGMTAGRV